MEKMSPLFSFILLIIPLLFVGSCGVPQTKTTLKVTSSMAIGNSSFKGGLVFYGRSSNGKFFSAPIFWSGSAASNSVDIVLDKGTWTFAAVGWKSDTNEQNLQQIQAKVLQGISECAVTTVNVDTSEKTVILDLDSSNCSHPEFGGNFDSTSSLFKNFGLVTCGTFYKNSALDVLDSDIPDYCSSSASIIASAQTPISPDLKRWAKSARIRIPAIRPGLAPLPNSPLHFCLDNLFQGNKTSSVLQRLPIKGVPFIVELFDSPNCTTDKIQTYELREGLKFDFYSFDHRLLQDASGTANLYLLPTISRRGVSSLMASIPKFSCGDMDGDSIAEPCILNPVAPTNIDRLINKNQEFYAGNITSVIKCNQLTSIHYGALSSTPSTALASNLYSCRENNGKVLFKITSPTICSPSCALKFTFTHSPISGTSTTNYINLQIMEQGLTSLEAYNTILGFIGHEDLKSTSPSGALLAGINSLENFYNSKGVEDKHFGILSGLRELFQPGAIGGLFYEFTTTASIIGKTKNISFWKDGSQQSFRIEVESDDSNLSDYLRTNSNPFPAPLATGASPPQFTHKITISKIVGGAFYPETIIRFVYGQPIGSLEQKEIEVDNGNQTTSRSLLFWNTVSEDHGRFEVYNYEHEIDQDENVVKAKTSFMRAERESTANEGNARLENFSYDLEEESNGDFKQRSWKNGIFLKNDRVIYVHQGADSTDDTPNVFFTKEELSSYNNSKSLTPNTSSALSPNGNHFVSSWAEHNGSNWVIKIMRRNSGGKSIVSYTTLSTSQPLPKVTINNQGHVTVAFIIETTTSILSGATPITVPFYNLYALAFDGTDWIYLTNLVPIVSASGTISSGTLSLINITPFAASANKMTFDLIDENPSLNGEPAPTTSKKHLVFSELDTTPASPEWKLKKSTFQSGNWGTPSYFTTDLSNQPVLISVTKADSSSFHLSWIYEDQSTTSTDFYMKSLTANLDSSTASSMTTALSIDNSIPKSLNSSYNSATKSNFIVELDSGNLKHYEYDASASITAVITSGSGPKRYESNPYCFTRARSGTRPVLNGTAQTSGCNPPETSYAPAIKSSVIINDGNNDFDVGFKHDIKSLNPNTFKHLFTIP